MSIQPAFTASSRQCCSYCVAWQTRGSCILLDSSECCPGAGLWHHSRHPNYFFEQLFWWSLALFGANAGAPWVAVGALFNTACMAQVTRLTEERMLGRPEREILYREYVRKTSVWVPMPAKGQHP